MKYLLMIYHNESAFEALSESERQRMYGDYRKLREQLIARGQYVGGSQLQPSTTAKTMRLNGGKELVTDGPFAETHEQLGGFLMVDVNNLDEALAIAKQIPSLPMGAMEVRALVDGPVETSG